ncbi:hypothetical protein FCV25MIE_27722 [Fagus crenata]
MAFWAPFMLLHLGGQDTITAYAMQDNQLWLRHLLVLVVQTGVALYIFLISWKTNWLSFLTIPMLLVGFIKYAERIWVMRSSNDCISDPYTNWVDHFLRDTLYRDFNTFKPLFLDRKVRYNFRRTPTREFQSIGGDDFHTAFKMIEIELGHAYDTFYTKTPLFSTTLGRIVRCITFSSTVSVSVFFLVNERHKYKHLQIDLIITYILLVGAVVIEIYTMILLIASDMGRIWLATLKPFPLLKDNNDILSFKPRWSNSMGQFNMLSYSTKNKPGISQQGTPKFFADFRVWFVIQILPKLNRELEMLSYKTNKPISRELKQLIWDTLREKVELEKSIFSDDYTSYISDQGQVIHLESYESIIVWHLATDIILHSQNDERQVIEEISDYMMYLVAFCPSMLSEAGNAKISVKELHANKIFLQDNKNSIGMSLFFKKSESHMYSLDSPPLLFCANEVARNLREKEEKWNILTRFWVENLVNAATFCQGNNHAQQLPKGGEFLTHVWFLIEHLNLQEIFRVPQQAREQARDFRHVMNL